MHWFVSAPGSWRLFGDGWVLVGDGWRFQVAGLLSLQYGAVVNVLVGIGLPGAACACCMGLHGKGIARQGAPHLVGAGSTACEGEGVGEPAWSRGEGWGLETSDT